MCCARLENVMPRRKSMLAQMYEARQKAKLQQKKLEEQAARAWAAEDRRVAAQAEKEAAQLRREEDRAAQAGLREEQQAERARQQAVVKAERLAAQQQREQERQTAAQTREQQRQEAADRRERQAMEAERRRRTVERRATEAEVRTEAVQATVAAFERLLMNRGRHLAAHSRHAEAASTRMARKRSWRRSSGRWPPRCTRRAWMARAQRSTSRNPASCWWNTSCPARV